MKQNNKDLGRTKLALKTDILFVQCNLGLPFCFEKEDLQIGFTRRELVQFLDGLVELDNAIIK